MNWVATDSEWLTPPVTGRNSASFGAASSANLLVVAGPAGTTEAVDSSPLIPAESRVRLAAVGWLNGAKC
ncbi:unnamed protein product [Gongylonema pulchrum]|uniref:BACK domain-containing protein n=1 Tax=Gongylonema pulchrum TaxID=637853 RepID=A0A183EUW0_9BILA|nr:unnamed protein product [Gongylonema pulchrum]